MTLDLVSDIIIPTIAIIVSVILAFGISWYYNRKKIQLSERANSLRVLIDMFREFRSYQFKKYIEFIHENLREVSAENGIYKLAPPAKKPVVTVSHFFDNLGLLVANDIVDENLVISFMGESLKKIWCIIWPFIKQQRDLGFPDYQAYFEDLVSRTMKSPPGIIREKIELQKLDEKQHGILNDALKKTDKLYFNKLLELF